MRMPLELFADLLETTARPGAEALRELSSLPGGASELPTVQPPDPACSGSTGRAERTHLFFRSWTAGTTAYVRPLSRDAAPVGM